ncbi:hypothetical protein C7293_09455 [filamentous cyanobacterium CCT1]|nr:hypothetical protein C7293_09455 [filamentous cyanobacterium CCT1]PSN81481.1 hypothetical protein C8B47_00905 [filamentous cyanobacterium CCP4]
MGILELLLVLLVAAICGGIGQSLAGYTAGGCLTSIVVGFIGAYIGVFIARQFGLPIFLAVQVGGQAFPIIWSVLGAIIFTLVLALINRAVVRR